MKKQLFFDDSRLFGRDNVVRKYGQPVRASEYNDGVTSTDYCAGWVFRLENGKYRMLYFGHSDKFTGKKVFAATSCDGVNFEPEKLWENPEAEGKDYSHEVWSLPALYEVAFIYEDKFCSNDERYKLLMSKCVGKDCYSF